MLGDVNKLFVFRSLLTTPSNVLPLHLKQTFPPIIWIVTEGDEIKSRLPFKIFFTLNENPFRTDQNKHQISREKSGLVDSVFVKTYDEFVIGCTLSQLAVAWCLRNSTSQSVIASANSTEQLLEILGSLPVICFIL